MPIRPTTGILGQGVLVESDPATLDLRDVIYSPMGIEAEPWGIFDHGRKLVLASAFYQGGPAPVSQPFHTPVEFRYLRPEAPEPVYIYGGAFNRHYGHFLLSAFCRFWNTSLYDGNDIKILIHSDTDIASWFELPFIRDLFAAMDLAPDRFVSFAHSCRVRRLIVPAPSFEETGFVHRAFARFGSSLGSRLAAPHLEPPSDVPLYLSKEALPAGVGKIINESDFTDVLRRRGITVVCPETLTLAEQIALLHSRKTVIGHLGSAFHTLIFAPARSVLAINPTDTIFSSYPMIDEATGTRATYLYPEGDIETLPREGTFYNRWRLTDPERSANEFLWILDRAMMRMPNFTRSG